MTAVVIDASAALAWMLPSQATVRSSAFIRQSDAYSFHGPAIFDWEVRNVLLMLLRRRSIASAEYSSALDAYGALKMQFEPPVDPGALSDLAEFARDAGLSLFDASYLALALDRGCGLASRDAALLRIAQSSGVECFDLRDTE